MFAQRLNPRIQRRDVSVNPENDAGPGNRPLSPEVSSCPARQTSDMALRKHSLSEKHGDALYVVGIATVNQVSIGDTCSLVSCSLGAPLSVERVPLVRLCGPAEVKYVRSTHQMIPDFPQFESIRWDLLIAGGPGVGIVQYLSRAKNTASSSPPAPDGKSYE